MYLSLQVSEVHQGCVHGVFDEHQGCVHGVSEVHQGCMHGVSEVSHATVVCVQGGEDLSSEFHNDLYQFNFEKRRWFVAEIRPPKKTEKDKQEGEGTGVMICDTVS